ERDLRRQLKLARPDLVPDQLSPHRVAPAVSSLLRGRFQGRMPNRFRVLSALEGNRQRTFQSSDQTLAARRQWRSTVRSRDALWGNCRGSRWLPGDDSVVPYSNAESRSLLVSRIF